MWMQLSADNSKYAFLLSIHPSFGMADVCQATWRFGLRRALCRFVLSSHKLEIETGRFLRPAVQRNQRYCVFCLSRGSSTVGDESHALDSCPQFSEERKKTWRNIRLFIPKVQFPDQSLVELLKILDRYKFPIRIEVWRAIALLTEHIQTINDKT